MIVRRVPMLAVSVVALGAIVVAGRSTEAPVGAAVRHDRPTVDARRRTGR